jgi:hypothetical protein
MGEVRLSLHPNERGSARCRSLKLEAQGFQDYALSLSLSLPAVGPLCVSRPSSSAIPYKRSVSSPTNGALSFSCLEKWLITLRIAGDKPWTMIEPRTTKHMTGHTVSMACLFGECFGGWGRGREVSVSSLARASMARNSAPMPIGPKWPANSASL